MKLNADVPPAVTLKGMADFATTEAWEADLVERITDRISWELHHPAYDSKYEVDVDVDLKEVDSKKIESLLLGRFFDGNDREANWEYLDHLDKQVVNDEARDIFKLFAQEIKALAEATDRDADDLKDEWLESDEFDPQQMECGVHYENYCYQGELAASVNLPFNLTVDTTSDHLWDALEFFRINASDFLAAAVKDISDLSADENGVLNVESLKNLECWSLSEDDIQEAEDGQESPKQNAPEVYKEKFVERQEQVENHRLCSTNKWLPGDAAISPESLIAYVKACAYGKDNEIETYLHLCLDANTAKGFSTRCAMHDLYTETMPVTILSGYLSSDSSPGYSDRDPSTVRLVKPVCVDVGSIDIDQKNSPEKGADTLLMSADLELYADLYEILCLQRKRGLPLDLSDPEDQMRLEKSLALLDGKPREIVTGALSRGSLAGFESHAKEFLKQSSSLLDQDDLDRALVGRLEQMAASSISPQETKQIEILIESGAKGNFQNSMGANALHLAASRLVPLSLLDQVAKVTDAKHSEVADQGNAFSLTLKALGIKGVSSSDEAKAELTRRLSWFLDQGIGLTAKALEYPKRGELLALERLDNAPAILVALEKFAEETPPEEIQRLKDKMFYNAAIAGNEYLAGKLVSCGARVDAVSRSLPTPCSLEQAIDQFAQEASYDQEKPARLNAIKAMARSSRLRNSAMSLIEEMDDESPAPARMRP